MKQKGFTLIEVLVSIALIGLLGFISFSGLSTSLNFNAGISERSKLIHKLELTNTLLGQDLIQSINRKYRDVRGDFNDSTFIGQNQSLSNDLPFLSFSINTLAKDKTKGAVRWVEYYLIDNKIKRKEFHHANRTEDTTVYNQTLLSKVEDVELRFYKDNSWKDEWPDRAGLFNTGLPKLVEVIFKIESLGTINKLFILSDSTS